MKFKYKYGNIIYASAHGDRKLESVIRYPQYNKQYKLWYTPPTLATYIDICKYALLSLAQDEATVKWATKQKAYLHRLSELQKGISDGDRDIKLPDSIDYVWEPFQHQKEALAFALNLDKCCLWLDMGLGKTYTSITLAKLRHTEKSLGNINTVLVIAPRSLLYQWEGEIRTLTPNADIKVLRGTRAKQMKLLDEIDYDSFTFVLVSYESISIVDGIDFDMFIMDEATKIKNPKAKRTEQTTAICDRIRYGVQLTGMAYVNNPLDLFSQLRCIDKTIYGTNQWAFSQRYLKYKKVAFGNLLVGFKNMDELKKRAYLCAFSRTKAQCLDLPEKVYQVRKVPLNVDQYNWYTNLVEQINNPLTDECKEQEVSVEYVVALMEKLQQITSGFIKTDTGEYVDLDSFKYQELKDILRSSNDKFIIWARHSYTIRKLERCLNSMKIEFAVLDRTKTDAERAYIKCSFKAGKLQAVILQLQSECRGNDFTCETSSVSAIFFENTSSIEERAQAEDRQHRIGMHGTAVYIDLVCEDTYDEGIMHLLSAKRNISEYIREQKLDILLGKGGSVEKASNKGVAKKQPKTPEEVAIEVAALPENQPGYNDVIPGLDDL